MVTQGDSYEFRPASAAGAVVKIRVPTERIKRRMGLDTDLSTQNGNLDMIERAVKACVLSVSGYSHGGKTITTVEDLVEYGDLDTFLEIGSEVLSQQSLKPAEQDFLGATPASSEKEGAGSVTPAPTSA